MIAFQTELRFPNVSFSVCDYLKPYLNPIKEHTILIVICTNEVFAIVIAAMCVSIYINILAGKCHRFSFSFLSQQSLHLSSSPLIVGPVFALFDSSGSCLTEGVLKALYLFTDRCKLGEIILDKVGLFVFISLGVLESLLFPSPFIKSPYFLPRS